MQKSCCAINKSRASTTPTNMAPIRRRLSSGHGRDDSSFAQLPLAVACQNEETLCGRHRPSICTTLGAKLLIFAQGVNEMSDSLPIVYLARHGETAWSLSGQHTGLTDLPLTERGERHARRLEERLHGLSFAKVFTSPLQRARRTCELAGFGTVAEIDRDLVEWNYGQYEGRRSADIRKEHADWQ